MKEVKLKRSLSLPMIILYGLGTMIGGGIYALTGKVAGQAGMLAPFSFALSASLALLTAFSYAELSSRFPSSAGEVRYVDKAFSKSNLSILIGCLVILMGVTSSATLVTATAGFIQDLINFPYVPLIVLLAILLGLVAIWGIAESVLLVGAITLIEIVGLSLIVMLGWGDLMQLPTRLPEMIPPSDIMLWGGVLGGSLIAFYAFIGFEDMVSLAEEVKEVRKALPLAIISCIIITLLLYILVVTVAVLVVPPQELANSNTPLAMIAARTGTSVSPLLIAGISLLATINGALVQVIMASRVLYGMAKSDKMPMWLGYVSAHTHTPIYASLLAMLLVMGFALWMDLETLARLASSIVLLVFATVNASLLKLKYTQKTISSDAFSVPWWVCLLGLISCCGMLLFSISQISFV